MSELGVIGPCAAACSIEATVTFRQASPEIVGEFTAKLVTIADQNEQAVKDTNGVAVGDVNVANGVARFEKLKCNVDYTVKVQLPQAQTARCAANPVLTKTQTVTANDGKFIFTLTSLPSLTVILYGDQARTQKLSGIKVKAKPAGNALSCDTDADGAAKFGYVAAGDYEFSLELTDKQKRCFKPIAQTVTLANDDVKVVECVLDPIAVLTVKVARQDGTALKGNVEIAVRKKLNEAAVKSATLDSSATEHTFSDVEPGEYFIGVAAQDNDEKKFRIGRTIARADADLSPAAKDDGRAEKVNVPAQHVTTVSFILAPPYKKVQFIGYYIHTGLYRGSDDPWGFMSEPDPEKAAAEDDIKNRCTIMKEAIVAAKGNAKIDADPETLKLFMAPEFYFRGLQGAYPIETISGVAPTPGIIERLQEETVKADYKDWLFVFGTAVGYQKIAENKYPATSVAMVGGSDVKITVICPQTVNLTQKWSLVVQPASGSPDTYVVKMGFGVAASGTDQTATLWVPEFSLPDGATLSLQDLSGKVVPVTFVKKRMKLEFTCAKTPDKKWEIRQSGIYGTIIAVENSAGTKHTCDVDIPSGKSFDGTQSAILAEPMAPDTETEIFNIALIQKGGPPVPATASGGKAIKEALVYKEYISGIDFTQGGGGKVNLHLSLVKAVSTEGAKGSKFFNKPDSPSELNKSGLGGGSILTIDDIDFGIEVCLDHGQGRLREYYQNSAKAGEPKIQIHLIPSCGMSIKNRPCLTNGWIFNVDKRHCVLEKNDGNSKAEKPGDCAALSVPTPGITDYFDDKLSLDDPQDSTKKIQCDNGHIVVYNTGDLPARATV